MKEIWDYINEQTKNPYGTAAIMGNLMAESSLNPKCVTGTRDPYYVSKADLGAIDFVHDGYAFGLAQWCFYTRKEGLLNLAKSRGCSVADLKLQLEYLIYELSNKYKSVWAAVAQAKTIREASDVVMLKYEKPSDTSEIMRQRRANYGQKYYDAYASADNQGENEPIISPKQVVVTTDRTNIRAGNGKNFPIISRANKGSSYEWIATSENGWHAIKIPDRVVWVSGEFSIIK